MKRLIAFAIFLGFVGPALWTASGQEQEAPPSQPPAAEPAAPAKKFELQVHPANLEGFDSVAVSTRLSADQRETIFSMIDTGNQQFAKESYFAAVHAFKQAEKVDTGNLTLLKPLGRACLEAEFFDQAAVALEPVHRSKPDDAVAAAALAQAYVGLLDAAMFENEFELSQELLSKIRGLEPEQEKVKALADAEGTLTVAAKVEALRATAVELRKKRRNPIAAGRLERLIVLAPKDYNALVALADTYGALRLYEKAEATYRQAMAIQTAAEDQGRLDVYLRGQARYFRDLKEFPKALVALEKLRVAHPEDPLILVDMSKAMAGADEGRSARAVETVKKAQAMAPNSSGVALAVAEIYKAGAQMDQATASLAAAAETSDNVGLVFKTLGEYRVEVAVQAVADKTAVETAIGEKAAAETGAAEKAAAATTASQQAAAAKTAAQRATAGKAAAEKAAAEKTAAVAAAGQASAAATTTAAGAAAQKVAADQAVAGSTTAAQTAAQAMAATAAAATTAAAEKTAADVTAAEKAAAAKAAADKAAAENTEEAEAAAATAAVGAAAAATTAGEKTSAANATAQQAAAAQTASEKATAEKAAAQKVAVQKAAAQKATAEEAVAAKAAVEGAAAEKATADQAAAAAVATEQAAIEKNTQAVAAAATATAEKAAADTVVTTKATALQTALANTAPGKAAAEKALAEKTAAEGLTAAKGAVPSATAESAAAAGAVTEKTAAAQVAAEKLTAATATAAQATAEQTAAQNTANEKVAAAKAATEKAAAENTEEAKAAAAQAATQQAEAEKVAAEKAAAVKTTTDAVAAAKAATDVAAAEQAAAQTVAAAKATAAKTASDRATAAKAAAEKATADRVAAARAAAPQAIVAAADAQRLAAYQAYKSSGLAYVGVKQWYPAIQSFTAGLTQNAEGDPEYLFQFATAHFNMPRRSSGALNEAIKHLNKATELDAEHLVSYSLLGDIYMVRTGRTRTFNPQWVRKAIHALQRTAVLDPNDAGAFYRLGAAYAEEARFVKAYAAYARAVELQPDNPEYLRRYAQAQVDQRRYEAALQLLDDQGDKASGVPVGIVRGRALAGLQRWEEVRDLCPKLTEQTEDNALKGQINALAAQANAALAKASRVGPPKLVVILFGDGTDSLKTWRDPERDAIPRLWNDLRPLGELQEAISLEGRYLPQDIAAGMTTGQWRPVAEGPATYHQQVRPVLMHYCGKCHEKGEAEGDFVVDDFQKMLQGGQAYEEEVIVSGKGKESYLVQSIVESEMPPKEALQDKQRLIDLLTKWIDEGVQPGEPVESWQLQAPTFLERFRADRKSPPEKVWAVVGDRVLDPLRASDAEGFGATVGPTFVCVSHLEESVARMQAVLADAAKQNLERPQVMELIDKLTPQDLAVPLENAAAAQLVTNLLKRERFIDKADDRLVHAIARDVLATHKPEVLLVAFSDPRDGSSAEAIRRVDASVHALWKQLEAMPEYRNNTNFVVLTSFSHENSANLLSIGPRTVAGTVDRGLQRVWDRPVVLTDMMVSIANLLAIDYEIPEGNLKPN